MRKQGGSNLLLDRISRAKKECDMTDKNRTKTVATVKKNEIIKKDEPGLEPFFVEAEKMFDRFAELSRETAQRAFEFFRARGGQFGREIDDWFNAESQLLRFLPVEISEKNGTVMVKADVAGFKPEEVEISVKDDLLMISGKTEKSEENKGENVVYSDFRSNRFFRQMTLPEPVMVENAKAEVKNGMLTISLPKAGKAAEPKHIAVAAG
jgi:HSP20 family protein